MPPEAPDSWIELIPLADMSRPGQNKRGLRPARVSARTRRILWLVLLLVILPMGLTTAYFTVIAQDRYMSEAKYVVRQPGMANRLGAQVISTEEAPKTASGEDSYAVRDFILSRDAMGLVIADAGLKTMLRNAGADWLWGFPSPFNGDSDEGLYKLYGRLVSADFESSTGMTTLHTQGFTPEAAQRIAVVLMKGAEGLLNRLNARAQRDAVVIANDEVERTRAIARGTEVKLTVFRTEIGMADPLLMARTVLETIAMLKLQLVETAAQLDIVLQAAPNSPNVAPTRARLRALQAQLVIEQASLGNGGAAFAPKIEIYERLLLQREFAEKTYLAALGAQRVADFEARKQQSYIEPVVAAGRPDHAMYPWRLLWLSAVLAFCLCSLLIAWPAKVVSARGLGQSR
jgi:capsular polysaccharide transport system permease protein